MPAHNEPEWVTRRRTGDTDMLLKHAVEELRKPVPNQSEVDGMSAALLRKSDIIRRLIEKIEAL